MVAAAPDPLSGERWRHRLVLVFAPDAENPALRAQRAAFDGAAAGLAERDVRVIEIVANAAPVGLTAAALRRQFQVTDGFMAVLVGKDGGTKLRSATPLTPAKLFAVIDAMPMRQDEVKRRTGP